MHEIESLKGLLKEEAVRTDSPAERRTMDWLHLMLELIQSEPLVRDYSHVWKFIEPQSRPDVFAVDWIILTPYVGAIITVLHERLDGGDMTEFINDYEILFPEHSDDYEILLEKALSLQRDVQLIHVSRDTEKGGVILGGWWIGYNVKEYQFYHAFPLIPILAAADDKKLIVLSVKNHEEDSNETIYLERTDIENDQWLATIQSPRYQKEEIYLDGSDRAATFLLSMLEDIDRSVTSIQVRMEQSSLPVPVLKHHSFPSDELVFAVVEPREDIENPIKNLRPPQNT